MQPFHVRVLSATERDIDESLHTASGACPVCVAGYPQPCPRITDASSQPVAFDEAGQATAWTWTLIRCPGMVHAELGTTGLLETRCAGCGVPP